MAIGGESDSRKDPGTMLFVSDMAPHGIFEVCGEGQRESDRKNVELEVERDGVIL